MTVSPDALDRFVGRVGQLYSLPAVAVKVLELTAQPQVDLRALKACIENDPALVTKVLRVVNSSLFALTCEVRDLNQALTLLGIKPLKLLILGFSLSETLCKSRGGRGVDRYWRHTLTQAVAAREISEQIWKIPGDEAFLAALLRDVGILVLLDELGEPYARFLDQALAADKDVAQLEESILGFDHRALAAQLLDLWHLPSSLVSAISLSLRPEAVDGLTSAEQALPRILRLAQLMADLVVDRRHLALERLKHEPSTGGPLSAAQIQALVDALEAKVEQLAGVFALELPPGIDYRDVLVEAHRQMSQVASDMTGDWLNAAAASNHTPPESALLAEVENLAAAAARFADRQTIASGRADVAHGPADRLSVPRDDASQFACAAAVPRHALGELAAATPRILEGTLAERLETALAAGRQQRAPLSLVLVEIDRFDALARSVGPIAAEQLVRKLGHLCQTCEVPAANSLPVSQACFALLLPGCDRGEAVEHGDRLRVGFRNYVQGQANPNIAGLTVSLGVATVPSPPRNFRVDDLIASANRCLAAAQRSGNALKSIGIY